MRAYDTRVGEFRAHYAGFFDPGFGLTDLGASKTRAVLEVRSHDVPFLIEQGSNSLQISIRTNGKHSCIFIWRGRWVLIITKLKD